ncbi:MAG: NAD(P)-dependent oxidoreductase [Rickettsiales bacterium]
MDITLIIGATGLLGKSIMGSKEISKISSTKLLGVTRNRSLEPSEELIISDYSKESAKKILFNYSNRIKNIIHCAGFPSVFMSLRDPINDHINNFDPVLFSLEIAKESKAKLFYISTVEMYGTDDCKDRSETSPRNPQNPYALNKMFSEEYIRLYQKIFGINFNILRPSIFIGDTIKKNIVFEIINAYQNSLESIPIYVDLNSKLNFIHVDEVTNIIRFLFEKNINNEIFNVGMEKSLSVNDLLKYFKTKYDFAPKINQLDDEYQYKTAPIEKLKSFGWKPKRDIFHYLDELVKIKI